MVKREELIEELRSKEYNRNREELKRWKGRNKEVRIFE